MVLNCLLKLVKPLNLKVTEKEKSLVVKLLLRFNIRSYFHEHFITVQKKLQRMIKRREWDN